MCRSTLELTLVKVFFGGMGWEQGHSFGYLGRLDSGHIVNFFWCNNGLYPKLLFLFISYLDGRG